MPVISLDKTLEEAEVSLHLSSELITNNVTNHF